MDAPRPGPWADLDDEQPDVADWPMRVHPPRRWAFETGAAHPTVTPCATCLGVHVPDKAALAALIRAISTGSTEIPCTCACCVVVGPADR